MKMAIIGSGPLAILAASHFDQMGAEVVLFQRSPLGGNLRFLMDHFPEFKIEFQREEILVSDFFIKEIVPAVLELEKYGLTKQGDVLRVHKRFLHTNEKIEGKSRLYDLFRVIYSLNPKDTILKQLEENPELFKELGADVINSLHRPVESFADFDIVIEAAGFGKEAAPAGAGHSYALNEFNLKDSSNIFYQQDIFTKLDLTDKKSIILVGEGPTAKLALLKMRHWLLSNPGKEIHWVTYDKASTKCGVKWLDNEVEDFLNVVESRYEKSKIEFEKKIHEWRDLEDYIKVKVPKPIEPTPLLVIHEGFDVTSVDRLLDREGVFATIESPDFRAYANKSQEMMTLAGDALCIARGVSSQNLSQGMNVVEPGYYVLNALDFDSALEDIQKIEKDILNYFKKAEE